MKFTELHIGQSVFFNATIDGIQVHAIGRIDCFADDDYATFYLNPWEFAIDEVVYPSLCTPYPVCLYDERFKVVDCVTGERIVLDDEIIDRMLCEFSGIMPDKEVAADNNIDLEPDDIEWLDDFKPDCIRDTNSYLDDLTIEDVELAIKDIPEIATDIDEPKEPERVYVFGFGDFGLLFHIASVINAIGFDTNAVIVDGNESDAVSDGKVVATNLGDVWIVHGRGCAFVKQTSTQGIMPVYRELDKWLKSHESDSYGKMDILNVVTGEVVACGHRCDDMWVWRH